jgi:hypothetical protein
MVTVTDYSKKMNTKDEEFFVLHLQGDVELIKSVSTGKFYAHVKKTSITSTLNEETCKSIIGKRLPGSIQKVECEAYEYKIPGTNDTVTLTHNYQYTETENVSVEAAVFEREMA